MKDVSVSATITTSFDNIAIEQGKDHLSEIQNKLINFINSQPGIRYRELLRLSGLTNGVLTYHITNLEKSRWIIADRNINNKITRYYPNNIPIEEADIIGHIRNNAARQIILFILDHDSCTFNELYKIRDFESITSVLSKYKESFAADKIVNNYTDIMESL